jgi:choline-sulfatase
MSLKKSMMGGTVSGIIITSSLTSIDVFYPFFTLFLMRSPWQVALTLFSVTARMIYRRQKLKQPNILYLMCDQFRYDCIAALGNQEVNTPNLDRLVRRGLSFANAYSTNPVCMAARLTLRTGCEPFTTGCYRNEIPKPMDGLPEDIHERCGEYLAPAMKRAGYRPFGIGKFHTAPDQFEDLGYEVQINTEELWNTREAMERDGYLRFLRENHPEYNFIEQAHGERTNMYYVPQMSPLPAEFTVEAYVADRAIEQITVNDQRPFFGFVSFVGPHPPFAPPVPYNRMYNPDKMPNPVRGSLEADHMDEQIPWMNHLIWAEDINDSLARNLRSRYYGEITYIDFCIGRILDALEKRDDADNTLICFFSDHGDHLGDHHAWQKESYFEESCRIPFLLSWPSKYPASAQRSDLVCLTDLFGIATSAAGTPQFREGHDILAALDQRGPVRKNIFACYGRPGTPRFKVMIREDEWKYIFLSNGNREQLFNLSKDPGEFSLCNTEAPGILARFRQETAKYCARKGLFQALEGDKLRTFPYTPRPLFRIHQFNAALGVGDFIYP